MGPGLDLWQPAVPDCQCLPLLVSVVEGGQQAWFFTEGAGEHARSPHQVGQAPRHGAPTTVSPGEMQPVENSLPTV